MIATKSPRVDPQRDVAQRAHPDLAELEDLRDLVHLDDRVRARVRRAGAPAPLGPGALAPAAGGAGRASRARMRERSGRAHQPPPLKKAPPPPAAAAAEPPPPSPPPPEAAARGCSRLPAACSCSRRAGRSVSPAFRPLRMIVELLPARPVTTRWRTCLPSRITVTRAGGDRAGGDVDAFGLLDDDFGGRAHAGLQPGFHLVELEGDVVAHHAAVARGEDGDFADVGRELAAFERFDGHRGDLADLDVADFGLAQRHHQLHRAEVAQDRERGAGGARASRTSSDELDEPVAERPPRGGARAPSRARSRSARRSCRRSRPWSCRSPDTISPT